MTVYGQIRRITTTGAVDPKIATSPRVSPTMMTPGPDGAFWFTELGPNIGRITTSEMVTEYPIPAEPEVAGERYPIWIAAGPDGALWFTETTPTVGRMTTAGAVNEYPISGHPFAIAGGPDRAVWFAELTVIMYILDAVCMHTISKSTCNWRY